MRSHRSNDEVTSITSASTSHDDDVSARQRRYAIQMTIRLLCFVGAVVTDGWIRWVLIAAAIFLPYFAVVGANALYRPDGEDPEGPGVHRNEHLGLPPTHS